jgi:hypothetical protein
VNGGDHGFGAILDLTDHVSQIRGLERLSKFADIGAADEGASGAGDDHRSNLGVFGHILKGLA